MVLEALDPRHAVRFFVDNGWHGFAVLGAVVLAVTGGEALYADMGHFGRRPIRLAWFALVLPALMLNYFGQGALLLLNPRAASQPFFLLAPSWALLPLVVLATLAAIIASQALISGAFSLTRQAIQLGYAPRLDIAHTSSHEMGQVYVPQVNWGLAVATICIVLGFESSSALAATYGIAVTMTMVITALLLHVVVTERWGWPRWATLAVTAIFLTVDLAFFGANLIKVMQGGWLPLVVAALLFTLMTTWKTGRRLVAERLTARATPIDVFMASLKALAPARVRGTAVFMTAQPHGTPPALVHNLRYNKVLHEHVVILTVTTVPQPVRAARRSGGGGIARAGALQREAAIRVHAGPRRARGADARDQARARARPRRRHLLPRPRDDHRHQAAGHGGVARAAVRADGPQRRARDGVLPPAARARRGTGRQVEM